MVLGIVGTTVLGVVLTAHTGDLRWLFAGLPATLVLFLAARLGPTGYRLAGDGVWVERKARPRIIAYRTIWRVDRELRPVGGLMIAGSNGVFGRFGRFWNSRLGFYRLYVANRESVVWLATDSGWIGLSPDRPDEFVDRLRRRLESCRVRGREAAEGRLS